MQVLHFYGLEAPCLRRSVEDDVKIVVNKEVEIPDDGFYSSIDITGTDDDIEDELTLFQNELYGFDEKGRGA